jgi:DNA-directed RNA polymerase subunit RPC12/RpoP
MMPVPTHLKGCVVPGSAKVDETPLKAKVECPCGGKTFHLLYPGQTHEYDAKATPRVAQIKKKFFFVIKAKCAACGKEHLLLDKDFHGWNGFVCHDAAQAKLPRPPLVAWKCLKCGELEHKAGVVIQTEGKQDFVEETDGEIDEDRWPDGFGWFTMSIQCTQCGAKTPEWVSYETM